MELTWPLALLLLAAVIPAVIFARRSPGVTAPHPLWFLGTTDAARTPRRGNRQRSRWLLVAALLACCLAATGPFAIDTAGSRVLVVDLSATRATDAAAVRARLAGFDEAVLVVPGERPRRLDARAATTALVPSRRIASAAELAAGVEAAVPGARIIEIAAAPPLGDNARISAARFRRDPLAPSSGRIVVEIALDGQAKLPAAVVARGRDGERGRAALTRAGDRAIAIIPYRGTGAEELAVALDGAADALATDDELSLRVPSLAPAAVWLDPALAKRPIAKALAVLPTVTLVPAPRADAIAVVTSTAWTGPARARVIVVAPPASAALEPLLQVTGSPLAGATPALLAEIGPIAIGASAGSDPPNVWLRAGPHPAVWLDEAGGAPALHVAGAIDGALLPIVLADALASPPLAPAAADTVLEHHAPASPPPAPAGAAAHRSGWPLRGLLAIAALLVVIETLLARPRRAALVIRVALVIGLSSIAWRGVATSGRRVVYILDVSHSVAPAHAAALRVLEQRAAALEPVDRAALVVVAGGARTVVPLGPPRDVVSWTRGTREPATLALDPQRSDLATGLAVAGAALQGAGGEIVLVGDGRDTERGGAALRQSAALIGRGFDFVPVDTGDVARVEAPLSTLHAIAGHAVALPITIEARVATSVDLEVSQQGRVVARSALRIAAGRTTSTLAVTLDEPGITDLDITIAVAGDPIAANNRTRARIDVRGDTPVVLRVDAAHTGALVPTALAGADTVVLDDVPGPALDSITVAALDDFVRGGGTLLWAAGPAVAATGAGAIERLLPLRGAGTDRIALMLVVDRSGSVAAAGITAPSPGAAELAAAARALAPADLFGAIAFDVAATEWVELAPVGTQLRVPLLPPARGGTDPTPALELAAARLGSAPPDARRVVVLVSDGGFPDSAAAATAQAAALARRGIRVEVISAGATDDDARARLAAIADAGGGRVTELAADLAAVIPAVRVVPAPPVTPSRALARRAWTDVLGTPPAALASGVAVSSHVALRQASDAVVLADVGTDPLLAIRVHGAGRVFAWTADLRGVWIDGAMSPSLIAAASAVVPAIEIEATAGAGPSQIDIRVTVPTELAGPLVLRARDRGFERDVPLIPDAPGTYRAHLDASASSVSIGNFRSELTPHDAELQSLGVAPGIDDLRRATTVRSHDDRARAYVPFACSLAVLAIVLAMLGRTRRALAIPR